LSEYQAKNMIEAFSRPKPRVAFSFPLFLFAIYIFSFNSIFKITLYVSIFARALAKNSSFAIFGLSVGSCELQMCYLCGGFPFQYFLVANLSFLFVFLACPNVRKHIITFISSLLRAKVTFILPGRKNKCSFSTAVKILHSTNIH